MHLSVPRCGRLRLISSAILLSSTYSLSDPIHPSIHNYSYPLLCRYINGFCQELTIINHLNISGRAARLISSIFVPSTSGMFFCLMLTTIRLCIERQCCCVLLFRGLKHPVPVHMSVSWCLTAQLHPYHVPITLREKYDAPLSQMY
jgi:hypothetical protein